MSEIKLSDALIERVQQVIQEADPNAQDMVVYTQYLSAIMGFVAGSLDSSEAEQKSLLEQLHAFALHVREQVQESQSQQPPAQDAFGIWRPGDN